MSKILKILKLIPCIFARISHVIEHIFCADVPDISFDSEEDL